MIAKAVVNFTKYLPVSCKQIWRTLTSSTSCGQGTDKYPLGSCAVVTGATMGIGLAGVKALLENGVKNIMMSDIVTGDDVINKLRQKYNKSLISFMKCDVTKFDEIKCLFDGAIDCFGHIDIIMNNAGIFEELQWSRMIDINLKGVVCGTFYGMQLMSRAKGGKGGAIVNVASILGLDPMAGAPVYTATKHGIIGFNKCMALPFHYKDTCVRVMAMCPGVTGTFLIDNAHDVAKKDATELAKQASKDLTSLPSQHVCYTGMCLVKMLRQGDTGSIWVTENEEIYEVNPPHRETIRRRS